MNKKDKKALKNVIASLLIFIGIAISFTIKSFNIYSLLAILFGGVIISEIIGIFIPEKQKSKKQKSPKGSVTRPTQNVKKSHRLLSDPEIMKLPISKLSWKEFERLCYLYYKDKGYNPQLTKDGADGGIDLIYTDKKTREKVAVQIKHYSAKNQVDVDIVRAVNSAKRNHGCLLAEIITSSTFTNPALVEADKFRIETNDIHWIKSNLLPWKEKYPLKKKAL